MEDLWERLDEAAEKQKRKDYYDIHIASPLLGQSSQPHLNNEDKKSDSVTIRLPSWARGKLDEVAKQEGISLNQLINNAVIDAIEKHFDRKEARQIYQEIINELKNRSPQSTNKLRDTLRQMSEERGDSE